MEGTNEQMSLNFLDSSCYLVASCKMNCIGMSKQLLNDIEIEKYLKNAGNC